METHGEQQPATTGDNRDSCQVSAKTAKPVHVRSGQATVAYWRGRLYRNSYKGRDGTTVVVPEYYVRLYHDGVTKQVRLANSNRDKAAEEALGLFMRLRDQGWHVVTSRQARLPGSPTIEEFCESYRKAAISMERSPREVSINLYCRSLKQICRYAGVKEIRQLTSAAVERGRDAYRAGARKNKRPDSSVQNTVAKIIRNAKACFSREARAILARNGVRVENPFDGIRITQEIQPVFSLHDSVVQKIWNDLPSLRDGQPDAFRPPAKLSKRKTAKPRVEGVSGTARIDFRRPHPASYAAIVLALAVGLRANECDKCRWSWFGFNSKGECFLEIKEEPDFVPKGGSARMVKIPNEVYEALAQTRSDMSSPYVLGGFQIPTKSVGKSEYYRCAQALRIANAWLRARGVEADKKHGNPLHRLRKQFGSEVATGFGLFAAQKLLGHSSPAVTAKYYAAQTELPALTHIRIVK